MARLIPSLSAPRLASKLLVCLGILAGGAVQAQDWGKVANISTTMGVNADRICVGESSRGDLGCPTYAPQVLANGTISATGLTINGVSVGGGASGDRITSSTSGVYVSDTGVISLVAAGSSAGYFNASGLVTGIISTTGFVSVTGFYSAGNARLGFGSLTLNSSQTINWGSLGNYNSIIGDSTSQYLAFRTSNSEAMRIVSSGNVGIGTSTPQFPLTISGTGGATLLRVGTASTYLGMSHSNFFGVGTDMSINASTSNRNIQLGYTSTNARVGIQLAGTPSQTLHVSGTALITSWTGIALPAAKLSPTAELEVGGRISATALTVNGVNITGGGGGATTFASLTDVSSSYGGGNVFLPSNGGTVNAVLRTVAIGAQTMTDGGNTGDDNVAVGYSALSYNNGGAENVAIGSNAMIYNSDGAGNVAMGSGAMGGNQTGSDNVGVGRGAFAQNRDGVENVAVGRSAMANSKGNNNTGLGAYAMLDNIGGSNNVAIGSSALYNAAVTDTVAVGVNAGMGVGSSTVFQKGTLLGAYSGQGLTTGSSNTLLGYNAGGGITTGGSNILIGAMTTPYSNTGNWQLNIGNAIWGNIGSGLGSANRIGINVTSPTANLDVSGTIAATSTVTGYQFVATFGSVYMADTQGMAWGGGTDGMFGKASTSGTGQYVRFITSGTEALRIVSTSNVGIGTIAPNAKLEVVGRISATTVQLATSPTDVCVSGSYGTLKVLNGRPYICRQ